MKLVIVLGLFSFASADFDFRNHVENISPEIRVTISDVEYDLYTPNNKNSAYLIQNGNVNELSRSQFDPARLNIFVVHGWTQSRATELNVLVRAALFETNYNVNLFVVDWSGPASKIYTTSAESVVAVGQLIGNFINSIQAKYGLGGADFVLIGHSLGAHVVGSAGATVVNKIRNIIGLDPAGPLFSLALPSKRLDPTDAEYVQAIHTDGNTLGLGIGKSIGHVDYYPNGGEAQPGCDLDLSGLCDHIRCYKYLAEAIRRGASAFRAKKCSSYTAFRLGLCANNEESLMGEIVVTTRASGDFYLATNSYSPFGQG